jgi:hypothetical protein
MLTDREMHVIVKTTAVTETTHLEKLRCFGHVHRISFRVWACTENILQGFGMYREYPAGFGHVQRISLRVWACTENILQGLGM